MAYEIASIGFLFVLLAFLVVVGLQIVIKKMFPKDKGDGK